MTDETRKIADRMRIECGIDYRMCGIKQGEPGKDTDRDETEKAGKKSKTLEGHRDPIRTRLGEVGYGRGASSRSRNTDPRRWCPHQRRRSNVLGSREDGA